MPSKEKKALKVSIDSSFKPILIDNMQTQLLKEDERGKLYLLRNPNNSSYIKIHESVYEIIKMFDGNRTLRNLQEEMSTRNIPLNISELTTLLAEEGFIQNLDLSQKGGSKEAFSFKIKLFTLGEKYMANLSKAFSFVANPFFKSFYIVFCIFGFALFVYNFPLVFSQIINVMNPKTPLEPLLLSIPIFYLVEFAHEFAHAASYHHYGGKSTDIGIAFDFLVPFFYASTPDIRWMKLRQNITILLAGPLTSLFFAESFMFLFLFESSLRPLWAVQTLFWHISTLITLSPIIRTDGYYVVQTVAKFPNLLQHGLANLAHVFKLLIRKISLKEYREYLSQYSASERKLLAVYTTLFPIGALVLIYFFVYLNLSIGLYDLLFLTPLILTGTAFNLKTYVLWIMYVFSITLIVIGIGGTLINELRRLRHPS
ncbi:MAG: hypothetical protein QXE76_05960 [Candidatus Bathyarchaeia archaeon]